MAARKEVTNFKGKVDDNFTQPPKNTFWCQTWMANLIVLWVILGPSKPRTVFILNFELGFFYHLRSADSRGRNSLHACLREIVNIFILLGENKRTVAEKKIERTFVEFVFRESMKFENLYMTDIHNYLHVFETN